MSVALSPRQRLVFIAHGTALWKSTTGQNAEKNYLWVPSPSAYRQHTVPAPKAQGAAGKHGGDTVRSRGAGSLLQDCVF